MKSRVQNSKPKVGAFTLVELLVIVAIIISLIALVASEWLARRAGTRLHRA